MFDVVYRDARGRLAELARALSAEQLRTPVVATPAWAWAARSANTGNQRSM
jgi:hypothetical protein